MDCLLQTRLANTLLHEAETLLADRQIAAAINRFHCAEQAGANADACAAGRWQAFMLTGNFAAAWQQSDAIRLRNAPDPHRFWNGESLIGKRVIVRCLHGLGDAVQMLRYLPLLRDQCAEVVIEVPPRLLPLAACFQGMDHVVTWGDQAPAKLPVWDVQVEVMELPYLFRTTVADLPIIPHYLQVTQTATQQMARRMGATQAPRVGIVWSASEWDPTRRLPMTCLARLLAISGVEFWNLQGGSAYEGSKHDLVLRNVHDAASFGDGLVPLASVIANLDLVLTVDTLAAHLAGALGCSTWVLLQHRADWRWMHERSDSPWYPTLRLFRQESQNDWQGLTTRICKELEQWKQS